MNLSSSKPLTFQELILRLQTFFAERGCVLQQPHDVEVGAGTMAPETFLRVLGPKPCKVAYVQPSRRPADGRYGENPNRLFKHMQLQVILKPPPENVQELYLESLTAIGIDLRQHDIKFEEDNWESPTLGAWGIGWQVMLDGLEITQFTYFQQCGGVDLDPICAELTYGLERLCAFLQDVDSIYDIVWARDPDTGREVKYGAVRLLDEQEFSVYNFEAADVASAWKHFELCEAECKALIDGYNGLFEAELRSAIDSKDQAKICDLVRSAPAPWVSIGIGQQEKSYGGVRVVASSVAGLGANTPASYSLAVLWRDNSNGHLGTCSPNQLPLPGYVAPSQRVPLAGRDGDPLIPSSSEARTEATFDIAVKKSRFPLLGAYDLCLKCSHYFNILDARGAISVTERVGVIARVRALAVGIAKAWMDQQYGTEKSEKTEPAKAAKKEKREKLAPVGSS